VKDLAGLLRAGFHVFVFPEATSTHGLHILPFKRALFTAAIEAERDVLPVCVRVEEINGEPFQQSNHTCVSWYDDMDFFTHLVQLVSLKSLKISVNYLEPISVKQFPDRYSLADQSYQQITQCYYANRPPEFQPLPLPARKDKPAFSDTKL
jgi:1-acyl-sn-glycerol-3-phosphate acyltransferase